MADDGDCVVKEGSFDPETGELKFNQVYSDGAVTTWTGRYDAATDTIVAGRWSGECIGEYNAKRQGASTARALLTGYRVISPTALYVLKAPSSTSIQLGSIGPGAESVSSEAPHINDADGATWVQLAVKHSREDVDATRKVLKGWVQMNAGGHKHQNGSTSAEQGVSAGSALGKPNKHTGAFPYNP